MTREYAASFGAWHALRPLFPRGCELSALRGREEIRERLNTLTLRSSADDISALEQELLLRFSHALLLVGRFLPGETKPLLRWLREEFDWYNFLLLAKKMRAQIDEARIHGLLFHTPIPVKEPPAPDMVRTPDELLAAFEHIIAKKERVRTNSAFSAPFENLEALCRRIRLSRLESIAKNLDGASKHAVGSYMRGIEGATPRISSRRGFGGECPAQRFLELAEARDCIRRLCEAAGSTS